MKGIVNAAETISGRLISFAQRLVQTPSLSGQEKEVADLIEEEMRAVGYDEVRRDPAGNVIGRLQGSGDGHDLVLNGHMDHVDAGPVDAWPYPPFSGTIAGGRLHGRGAADMKGSLAAQVYAVAVLKEAGVRPRGDVTVTAVVQEETGGLGTQQLIDGGLRADYAVVGEATNLQLMRGHRGRLEILAIIEGRSVHASAPERGANPFYTMARFLEEIRGVALPRDPDFGGASVAPTLCRSDQSSSNVIPGLLTLHLDYRCLPAEEPGDVVKRFQSLLDASLLDGCSGRIEIERTRMITYTGVEHLMPNIFSPFKLEMSHPLVVRARRALAELTGREPDVGLWRFSTDGGRLMKAGIPTVGYGPGEEELVHTVGENIRLDDLVKASAGYAALSLALSHPDTGS